MHKNTGLTSQRAKCIYITTRDLQQLWRGKKMLFTVRTMRNTNTLYVHHYVDILVLNTNHCP